MVYHFRPQVRLVVARWPPQPAAERTVCLRRAMPRDRRGDFSSHILFTREELFPPSSPEDLSFSLRSWDRVPELCLHSRVHGDEVTTSGFGEAAFVVCGGRGASPPGHGREWTPSPGQSCASKRGGQGQLWEQPGGSATRRRLEQSTEQAYGFVTPHPSIKLKSKYLEPHPWVTDDRNFLRYIRWVLG